MRISLKVIIYLTTASVRLSPVTGNKGGRVDIHWKYHEVVKHHAEYFSEDKTMNHTPETGMTSHHRTGHAGEIKMDFMKTLKAEEHIPTKRSDSPALQTTESSTTRTVLHSGRIAIVVVCLALLLILLLCRHKLPRIQVCCAAGGSSEQRTNDEHDTEENHGDHHYDEIPMRNQQASSGDALLSVYATVNPPADQLHYACVNFQKRNAPPDTEKTCDSSSIRRSQGDTHDIEDGWVWVSHCE